MLSTAHTAASPTAATHSASAHQGHGGASTTQLPFWVRVTGCKTGKNKDLHGVQVKVLEKQASSYLVQSPTGVTRKVQIRSTTPTPPAPSPSPSPQNRQSRTRTTSSPPPPQPIFNATPPPTAVHPASAKSGGMVQTTSAPPLSPLSPLPPPRQTNGKTQSIAFASLAVATQAASDIMASAISAAAAAVAVAPIEACVFDDLDVDEYAAFPLRSATAPALPPPLEAAASPAAAVPPAAAAAAAAAAAPVNPTLQRAAPTTPLSSASPSPSSSSSSPSNPGAMPAHAPSASTGWSVGLKNAPYPPGKSIPYDPPLSYIMVHVCAFLFLFSLFSFSLPLSFLVRDKHCFNTSAYSILCDTLW